jgi:hypothetical protein
LENERWTVRWERENRPKENANGLYEGERWDGSEKWGCYMEGIWEVSGEARR